MIRSISKFLYFVIAGYLLFSFLKFRNLQDVPQIKTMSYLKPEKDINGTFLEKTLSNVFINVLNSKEGGRVLDNLSIHNKELSEYISIANNEEIFITSIIKEGTGEPILCGDQIQLKYYIQEQNQKTLPEYKDLYITIGSEAHKDIQYLLYGHKLNEQFESKILTPSKQHKLGNFSIKGIKSNIHKSPDTFLKLVGSKIGDGSKSKCNESVTLQLDIISSNESKSMQSSRIDIYLNEHSLPREILELVLGNRYGSVISLLTNKNLVQRLTYNGESLFNTKSINKKDLILLDISFVKSKTIQ